MLYYFKKGKNKLKLKKDLCSALRRRCYWLNVSKMVCKVLCWRLMPDNAPWFGRPVEVDSEEVEKIIDSNQCYTMQDIANILKISKSITGSHVHHFEYVNHFDVCIPHKLNEKTFLTIFLYAVLSLNVMKTFHFKNKSWWAMNTGYCTVIWNGRDREASEMNPYQPQQKMVFI